MWETSIIETDDPRWIEAEKAVDRLSNAETDAAIALVDVGPITLAGMAQLLDYILYRERRGDSWPGNLEDDAGKPRSWEFFLFEKLSVTLRGMVA